MKKWQKLMLIILVLALGLTGCASQKQQIAETEAETQKPEESSKVAEQKLTLAMNPVQTLNPLYNTDSSVQQALYLVFSPLINIKEDGSIEANLAESWMLNEAGTAVTITLNSNALWHDGQPVTSDDVIYTLNQIKAIGNCPYKAATENVAAVERVDDHTFKILYNQAFSGILQTLFFPVIPEHIYAGLTEKDVQPNPVGSGPFEFDSMTPQKEVNLKANTSYFKGTPIIQTIKIQIIPDEESALYAFKQGLIDITYTNKNEWGKYTSEKAAAAYEMNSNVYEFIGLNFNKPIFQDPLVREALLYAIDRDQLVHQYYLDHAVVTDTPISPYSYLYDNKLEIKSFNREKAKYLLTEAGYERTGDEDLLTKNGNAFSFTLLVNKENKERVKVAEALKEMYKEVGINMQIEAVEKADYLGKIKNKSFDAFLGGWQLSYALDLSFALHSSSIISGENYAGYKDEEMDKLLTSMFTAPSSKLKDVYSKFQQYYTEKNPYLSLYFKKNVIMAKNDIINIAATPLNIYAHVEMWKRQ